MSINKGGPAFPCLERGSNGLDLSDHGMTLRDYFAGQAMQALMQQYQCKDAAARAYMMADAMLKAREGA